MAGEEEEEEPLEGHDPLPIVVVGVTEGEEINAGSERFALFQPRPGLVLEVCLAGSTVSLAPPEEWFALSILQASGSAHTGWRIGGVFLGCESADHSGEVGPMVDEGFVHVCAEDPCTEDVALPVIHATRVRLWRPSAFKCTYLRRGAPSVLRGLISAEKAGAGDSRKSAPAGKTRRAAPGRVRGDGKGKGDSGQDSKKKTPAKKAPGVIPVVSDGEEEGDQHKDQPQVAGQRRAALRDALQKTKERILGSGGAPKKSRREEAVSGGAEGGPSDYAAGSSALVAGTLLNPRRSTPLRLAALEDSNDAGANALRKKASATKSASGALLAQAVQQSAQDAQLRRRRRRRRDRKDGLKQLISLLQGKKKKKGHKTGRRNKRRREGALKPDPDGPDDSGSTGDDSDSYYSDSQGDPDHSGDDSDLSMEPPLRRKATKEPGSVMAMLVRHAQEQLDRGALLEGQGDRPGLTTGIKISTYFALLIRPYHSPSSPLLRELYALAQSIDLLRMGRLPETADALASRFIAVHTAMSEGNWQAASQLELFPLEPVQSATTATMLEAHKHRRLILKSQGYPANNRWWPSAGRGKGGQQNEKGKKSDGRGKGKGKPQGKDKSWGAKGDVNVWKDNKEDPPKKT